MRNKTVKVLNYLKSDLDPDTLMGELSSGQQKTVEIAKGLIFQRKVIILDNQQHHFLFRKLITSWKLSVL